METGRNDPCPCGSGKKYKKCCMGQETGESSGVERQDIIGELKRLLAGQNLTSIEEAQAFVNRYMNGQNEAPLEDFQGLSAEKMHRFLHFPFESPDLARIPEVLATPPSAPVATLFRLLVDAVGDKGLKATATGNLPRNFCREAAELYRGEDTRLRSVNKEMDFFDLHVTRLTATLAGLLRKYRGSFTLTRECVRRLDKYGMSGIYPLLLRAYVRKFNWAYRDYHQELPLIQQSFLFTLYLLSLHGHEWMPHIYYEDAFLRAFPGIFNEVMPGRFMTPEEEVRSSYTWRTLHCFAAFFGLAEVEAVPGERHRSEYRVRALPLLVETVRFRSKG